jgi:LPS O-antigen subunit length determinant protein (WzzB/FepE family)
LSVRADSQQGEGVSLLSGAEADSATATSPQAETLHAFDQWADRQDYYSHQMIVEMRDRLCGAFASLPSSKAAQFRDEFIAKLSIFGEPQSQDAEQWLAETLAVASDSYAKKVLATLPDIVADSPGETRAKLRAIANRAINLKQIRQGFDQTRQATIQAVMENELRQAQFNAQVRASMTYSTPNLYSPAAHNGPAPYQRYGDYFNQRYGSPFSYGFPFSFAFGGFF